MAIKSDSDLKEIPSYSVVLVKERSRLIRSWIVEMEEEKLKEDTDGIIGNGNGMYL